MPLILVVFGVVLMAAVLISERADNTVLSTSVLFLAAGFLVGTGVLGWADFSAHDGLVRHFTELALFSILFVDGAELKASELVHTLALPGRALLLGMPLTIGALALAGHLIVGMTWIESFLVGAILSPTDPVFVSGILERESVPLRLRRLLGVESGLNDGLALPVVMTLIAVAGEREVNVWKLLLEAGLGVLLGIAISVVFVWLERRRFLSSSAKYRPLAGFAIATTVFGLGRLLHVNEFLGAYTAGITLASISTDYAESMREIGQPLAELAKLGTLLVFGAVVSGSALLSVGIAGLVFAIVALIAARPLAMLVAMVGGGLNRIEWLSAAWFGPRGFGSLLYALLMLQAPIHRVDWLFCCTSVVIVLSIILHSSTDSIVARAFARKEKAELDTRRDV